MRLEGKVALVTGGGSGIGRETAILLAQEGAEVFCLDVNESGCEKTIELAAETGARIHCSKTDVSSSSDVEKVFRSCLDQHGKLDIVCHCAAVLMEDQPQLTEELSEEVWERVLKINLTGTFVVCKYAIIAMKPRKQGTIINVASTAAFLGNPYHAYTASKGGVIALSKVMAGAYAPDNIRVNVICPGPVDTSMMGSIFADSEAREAFEAMIPLGRIGRAGDIAQMIRYLASDESSWVTGGVFVIDGGCTAR